MNKRHIFLTGPPRVGKTTVVLRVVEDLRRRGVKVGGMLSMEIQKGDVRVGFKIVDLGSGAEGILAHISQKTGPKLGKYRVCLEDLEGVGAEAIIRACKLSEVIIIDEIGPMELYSNAFINAVSMALNSGKILLGTIHYRVRATLIDMIRSREDVEIITVTYDNRDHLPKEVVNKILIGLDKDVNMRS